MEKPRTFDPRGQATMTPEGKIRLTLCGKIKLTPEKQLLFRGFFVVLSIVLADGLSQNYKYNDKFTKFTPLLRNGDEHKKHFKCFSCVP